MKNFGKKRAERRKRERRAQRDDQRKRNEDAANEESQGKLKQKKEGVVFETVNPNAKGTMKDWLMFTDAKIVMGQEIKADKQEADDLTEWCAKRGWQALISPRRAGEKSSERSAGVGIFVRDGIGLGWFEKKGKPARCEKDSRAMVARVDIPGCPSLAVVSTYMHVGKAMDADATEK